MKHVQMLKSNVGYRVVPSPIRPYHRPSTHGIGLTLEPQLRDSLRLVGLKPLQTGPQFDIAILQMAQQYALQRVARDANERIAHDLGDNGHVHFSDCFARGPGEMEYFDLTAGGNRLRCQARLNLVEFSEPKRLVDLGARRVSINGTSFHRYWGYDVGNLNVRSKWISTGNVNDLE